VEPTIPVSQNPFHEVVALLNKVMTLALLVLTGCASTGVSAVDEPARATDTPRLKQIPQVIVKFRDPALDPTRQGFLRTLVRDTGVKLVYVRPMSGGAHVLRIEGAADLAQYQHVVNELATRSEIEYAEPDRLLQHMPQR
jgi:hypothetical protein